MPHKEPLAHYQKKKNSYPSHYAMAPTYNHNLPQEKILRSIRLPQRMSPHKNVAVLATCLVSMMYVAMAHNLAVMSIDLGSEFMKIAIVKPGVPMEIVLNEESSRKTSTIVAMRDGERMFMSSAENTAVKFPKKAFWYLTQIVGKRFDDPDVVQYRQRFPYYDIIKDEERGTPIFRVDDETSYTPEELLAMVLEKAKVSAEVFAENPITDAVITVPVFFTQSERKAILDAAEMINLNVLQIISDNAAVALNFGVFRRKQFNATMQYYMFYDAGATSTTATIVGYHIVKTKEGDRVETNPQLVIKGVGFDRSLGGLEMTLRLRDHLAKLFNKQKLTKTDVFTNERSMGKLFKEANRLKKVLSANTDHMAQVEGLLEDIDFKAKVSREEFEEMNKDLFERALNPIKDALKVSQITLGEISDVILMGGGTRVPKIQDLLLKFLGRSGLGKSINTDEAAALGAVYHAAHLGKGFKVKKFGVKEACLYPIVVEFEKQKEGEETSKTVRRTLFGRMNPYPQKKVMTFNKHFKDFNFNVSYGDLSFLTDEELKMFKESAIHSFSLSGVETAHTKHKEKAESKGVKAHFRMDESGILHLDTAEAVFETEGDAKEESTWSKLGDTISGLFGGSDKKEKTDEGAEEQVPEGDNSGKPTEGASDKEKTTTQDSQKEDSEKGGNDKTKEKISAEEEEKKDDKKEDDKTEEKKDKKSEEKTEGKTEEKKGNKTEEGSDKGNKTTTEKKEEKPKVSVIKEEIAVQNKTFEIPSITKENKKASKKKLSDLAAKDKEKKLLEKAKNNLESFIFNTGDKLIQEEYEKCSTEGEREDINKALAEASDWMYDQDDDAKREVYTGKLSELKKLTKDLEFRVKEYKERPKALEALHDMINSTEFFLVTLKNMSQLEEPIFTEVEITTLSKLINETKEWRDNLVQEQEGQPLTEKPKLLVEDLGVKYYALDREVKYLINKAKNYRPKAKPKKSTNETEGKKSAANETKGTDDKTANDTKDTDQESTNKNTEQKTGME
ncbi:hypothetical protein FSP39_012931 [Pinctada imbricata]|uniref:Hypoxia up-regulated protein 1 n=1 Tax=Pinctada imbricata TaxID=66713 RepID=A0AA89CA02_PINIB|nr:hypothetical protein FSP39_012931 [Pinctada imbricata]